MNDRLRAALEALKAYQDGKCPCQREAILIEGLNGLAEEYGRKIHPTYINANGEMDFFVVGPEGLGEGRPSGTYGEELAAWLAKVPRRTGVSPTEAAPLPENGWCRINHFDVERLLSLVAQEKLPSDELDQSSDADAPAPRL